MPTNQNQQGGNQGGTSNRGFASMDEDKQRAIAGSLIGGIAETQEMLDFCAEHGIVSDIEMIAAQDIDKAYDRMVRSDVKYRFVIDSATL